MNNEANEPEIKIKNFEGPLDVLYFLVKDKKTSIMDIDLSELATQYLSLIDKFKNSNLDLASEYLVMAASLLQLKTKIILENPEDKKEIEQAKHNILSKLIEYHRFKEIAQVLRAKEKARKKIFIKRHSDLSAFIKEINKSKLSGHSSIAKLIFYLQRMFERVQISKTRLSKIEAFNLSPEDRRRELLEMMSQEVISFEKIFSLPTINHFVVTMITVLDMARKQELTLYQEKQFSKIIIKKGDKYEK